MTKQIGITLLGNNSGRNLGDAAILSSILENLSKKIPEAIFYVPSIAPGWISKHYGGRYRLKAVNVMPWTASLRLLGLPTLLCLARSRAALICDGIIFGKRLFNPAFNYLITLVFIIPIARILGCRVACFNCGIGPFPTAISRWCAKFVLNQCDLITMRDSSGAETARSLGVRKPIEVTGDSAFINPVSSRERALEVCKQEGIDVSRPIIGLNITSYLDTWLKPNERLSKGIDFVGLVAEAAKRASGFLDENIQLVVFSTQPMDENVSRRLSALCSAPLITNSAYLSHDIQAVMRLCSILVGMRFHSLILASAVEVPVVGMIYAPKVRALLALLESEHFGLELANLSPELLSSRITEAWQQRAALKQRQQEVVTKLRAGAHRAADLLMQKCLY